MRQDRWIPRSIVLGYLAMLAVLGGFTAVAFTSQTGMAPETPAPEAPWQATARLEAGRILVTATDTAGHPLSALSVRGIAVPEAGGTPLPLRFAEAGPGLRVADWAQAGAQAGAWRAELTLRQGAALRELRLELAP